MVWPTLCLLISLAGFSDAVCSSSEVVYAPKEIVVIRGDTAELICIVQYENGEECGLKWLMFDPDYLRPKDIDGMFDSKLETLGGIIGLRTSYVYLSNVQDSRTYRCQAQNGGFSDVEVTVVDPTVDDEVVALRPSVADLPEEVYVEEGDDVPITCVIRYDHEDRSFNRNFKWVKMVDGEPRETSDTGGKFSQSNAYNYDSGLYTHVLFLVKARKEDAGRYRCQLNDDMYKETKIVVL